MRTSSKQPRPGSPGTRRFGVSRATALRARWTLLVRLFLVPTMLVLGGCDEGFEPVAPGDISYSIWGYLDATEDTQWIRVMPVRETAVTTPAPSDITVTLEHVGSGDVVLFEDSLFSFERGEGGTLWTHNFWTDAPIEPGAEYRFRAERPGEPIAEADIRIPPRYDPELWVAQLSGSRNYIRLPGVKYVAYARESLTLDAGSCGDRAVQPYAIQVDSADDGESVMIPLATFHFPETCGPITMTGGAQIAASGSAWPSELEYAPGVLGEVDILGTNITHAVGFLGGLLTRNVPYQACAFVDPHAAGVPAHCKLRFSDESATVQGMVGSPACGILRIADALVTLEELEGEPAAARRIRNVRTTLGGEYRVLALEPGIPHLLTVRPPATYGPDVYEVYTDTLQLAPGETLDYDVALTPVGDCGGGP